MTTTLIGQERDPERLPLGGRRDPAPERIHLGLTANLGPYHQDEEGEGGHLDASSGGGAAGADEHQHVGGEQGVLFHRGVVERVEARRAWLDALEEAREQLASGRRAARASPALFHSKPSTAAVPNVSRKAVIEKRELRVQRPAPRGERSRPSSSQTGKPMPPAMIAKQIVTEIQPSVTNWTRLSLQSAKPALLKEVTAWKIPRQTAEPAE